MHDSAKETLDSSQRNSEGKFYPQINLSVIFGNKNSVCSFSTSKIKYLNVFAATWYINIHARIVMPRMSRNHTDILIHVSLSTELYLHEIITNSQTLQIVTSTNIS